MVHRKSFLSMVVAGAMASLAVADVNAGEIPPAADKLLTAYEANFQIAMPFRIVMRRFGYEGGKEILTDQRILRGMNTTIDFQTLIRRRNNSGVQEERFEELLYDGKETLNLKADFPGIGRELTLEKERGVYVRVNPGRAPRLDRVLERRVLEMEPYVVSLERKTFRECAELADKIEVVEGERPKLMLRLPDTTNQWGVSYSSQQVELEFDRDHGWWVNNAIFRATMSQKENKYSAVGRMEVLEYHTLKNGGYFPKSIQDYNDANPERKEQKGPRLEVVSVTINPDPPLKSIELKIPAGLAATNEVVVTPGAPQMEQIIVAAQDGTRQSFDSEEAFEEFRKTAATSEKYKGAYLPEIDFEYLYTSIEAAQKASKDSKQPQPAPDPKRKKAWFETGMLPVYGTIAVAAIAVLTGTGVVWRRRLSAK